MKGRRRGSSKIGGKGGCQSVESSWKMMIMMMMLMMTLMMMLMLMEPGWANSATAAPLEN